ncbi:hypothetical protein EDD18DRAFT_1100662 [Armillaria luteobubalina]|uniref:Uncharacterized protein n=1 Tax=Armillaria luteobubalina TaxID=153913 RepID=A0AA39QFY2_9AGAR|nr:hypothetical protein EDD18DRAFT_1100662 [Armillaria luteobubalina]
MTGSGRADTGRESLCTDEKDQQAVILERIHAKDSCASCLVPESTPIASLFSYRNHGSEDSSQEVEAAGNIEAPVFMFGGCPPSSAGIPMPLLQDVQALFVHVLFKGGGLHINRYQKDYLKSIHITYVLVLGHSGALILLPIRKG